MTNGKICQTATVTGRRQAAVSVAELAEAIEAAADPLLAVWAHAAETENALVSNPQLRALMAIDRHGALNLNALASEMGTVASSASRLVDRLVAAGLIERELSEATRREVTVTLRPAGRQLLERLQHIRRSEITSILADMTPTAARALARGMREFATAARHRQETSLPQRSQAGRHP